MVINGCSSPLEFVDGYAGVRPRRIGRPMSEDELLVGVFTKRESDYLAAILELSLACRESRLDSDSEVLRGMRRWTHVLDDFLTGCLCERLRDRFAELGVDSEEAVFDYCDQGDDIAVVMFSDVRDCGSAKRTTKSVKRVKELSVSH